MKVSPKTSAFTTANAKYDWNAEGGRFTSEADANRSQARLRVRRDAEQAAAFLATSLSPAVLVTSEWHVPGVPFEFEHLAIYQAVAAKSNFFVGTFAQDQAGGQEHYLFIAKKPDL